MSNLLESSGAEVSTCGTYRYTLSRTWDESLPPVLFVMLNPSTANAETDDPTIRRCVCFARDWGYGGLLVGNLFAYRATKPSNLPDGPEAVGPDNDDWLLRLRAQAGVVVAAWGAHTAAGRRASAVAALLGDLHALRVSKKGRPWHPLYLPAALKPVPWSS